MSVRIKVELVGGPQDGIEQVVEILGPEQAETFHFELVGKTGIVHSYDTKERHAIGVQYEEMKAYYSGAERKPPPPMWPAGGGSIWTP